jgi:hypothetical protein
MKKTVLALITAVFISLTSAAFSMDYMLGAKAGYFAWQPFYSDMGADGSLSDVDWGTGVLYGPIISLIFTPELSLSVSGLMGRQSTHWKSRFSYYESDPGLSISGDYYFDVFRADIDSALIYQLGGNFRIFGGYKYQYMKTTLEFTELRISTSTNVIEDVDMPSVEFRHYCHGPALGIGYSYPITQVFFASLTVSGVYMWGTFNLENEVAYGSDSSSIPANQVLKKEPQPFESMPIRQMGVNIEPAVGMSPGPGMPIVTLGVRYQRFRVNFPETTGEPFPNGWFDDTMIGVFVSAVYVF